MPFNRTIFFDTIRPKPFANKLTQQQVDGMNAILDAWETDWEGGDTRWLANSMAQTFHETSQKMWPIEEYGKGGNASYAQPVPETGKAYYGRGLIQLTWDTNYKRADTEMGWTKAEGTSCYWNPDLQLKIEWAAPTMFEGMNAGWFRSSGGSPNNWVKYFNATTDDVFNAREIINGDKNVVPSWSNGVSIGKLIVGYHQNFLAALKAAYIAPTPEPEPEPEPEVVTTLITIKLTVKSTGPVNVVIEHNEEEIDA